MKKVPFHPTIVFILLSVLTFSTASPLQAGFSDDPWDKVDEILARIVAPVFPDKDFMVTDYGAIPDGQTDCRSNILDAITACHEAGGGRVIVPAGDYISEGPLLLKSNVNLHLQEGAYLKFGINPEDYLTGSPDFKGCVKVRWEGLWCYNYSPVIYAWKEKKVAITGKGIIDGQTDKFWAQWYIKKLHTPDRLALRKMGMEMVPVEKRIFGKGHHLAPETIELYHCQNVLIEGSTFFNHDDAIALKSGRAKEGWPENGGRPTENVIIRNNIFHGEHNGISVGSDMSGGVKNIFVYDCQFGVDFPQQYVFNAKSNADRGGNVSKTAISIVGLELQYIQDIHLINVRIKDSEIDFNLKFVKDVYLKNVSIQ